MRVCKPSVSVVMPIYNAEETVAEAIRCLRGQDLESFEAILVDDGSTDDTPRRIRDAVGDDDRFLCVRQDNAGAASARNNGLRRVRGAYTIFLDADDLFEDNLLSGLYGAATCAGAADAAVCQVDSFASGSMPDRGRRHDRGASRRVYDIEVFSRELYQRCDPAAWNKLFRTELLRELRIEFQHLHHANDTYFVFVALAHCRTIATTDEVLVHYRIGTGGSLRDSTREPLCDLRALDAVQRRLADDGTFLLYPGLKRSLDARCVVTVANKLSFYASRSCEATEEFHLAYFGGYEKSWGIDARGWPYLRPLKSVLKCELYRRADPAALYEVFQRHPVGRGRTLPLAERIRVVRELLGEALFA